MAERIVEIGAGTYDIRGDSTSQVMVPVLTAGTIDQSGPKIGSTLTVGGSNVSGGPTTAYQWQQSADGSTWANIPGATGASLGTSSGVTAGYHVRRGVSDGAQGPIYTAPMQVGAAATGELLTIADFNEASDTLDLISSKVGTCHYGIYPGGTVAGGIVIKDMIAGTDKGLIENGTAGIFVTAGALDDVEIGGSALTAGTEYVIAFVVDIDDSGTFSNVALQSFGAKELAAPPVAEDTFIAANGTNLMGRTADLGGVWVLNDPSSTSSNVDINGNALRFGASGGARYYYLTTPSAENVEVRANIGYATGVDGIGLLARVTGDGATLHCYFGRIKHHVDICELYRFSNGKSTLLGTSGPLGLGASGTAELVLRCRGTTIEVDCNGGTVISVTNGNVTGPGTVGLGHYRGSPGTMDTFSAISL